MAGKSKSSFAYNTLPANGEKLAIFKLYTRMEQHRKDPEAFANLMRELDQRVQEFRDNKAYGLPNPDWQVKNMEATAAGAKGDCGEAIRLDIEALENAKSDEERAISHNNLSDSYRRVGNFEMAVTHGRQACRIWPDHGGIVCNFGLALLKSGCFDEAVDVLDKWLHEANPDNPKDIITAHVRHEVELREMLEILQFVVDREETG